MQPTISQYSALVERLEETERRSPKLYLLRVIGLAGLGYGYMAAVALGALALILGIVGLFYVRPGFALKALLVMGIPALFLIVGLIRALRVRFDAPEGERLTRADAPKLFDRIEAIRKQLQGPTVHEVILDGEMNAAIVGKPRLGILGWHKNYLILGLPLLAALSEEEFDAVIAHELGHLSGNHGKISGWIYRIRKTWAQVAANVDEDVGFVFERFFSWYIPYFNAYSFVLARAHEYEADAAASEVTSPDAMIGALTRLEVVSNHLEDTFWPSLRDLNRESPEAPKDLYGRMTRAMASSAATAQADTYLRDALERKAGFADTHPSLQERAEALGVSPVVPPAPSVSAGEAYFGSPFNDLIARWSSDWHENRADVWRAQHEDLAASAERLEKLEGAAQSGALQFRQMFELGSLYEKFNQEDKAIEVFEGLIETAETAPRKAQALYAAGDLLACNHDDPRGAQMLEKSLKLDPFMTPIISEILAGYYMRTEDLDAAQAHIDRRDVFMESFGPAFAERQGFAPYDDVIRPVSTDEEIERVRALGAEVFTTDAFEAYFFAKRCQHYSDRPPHYLAIIVKTEDEEELDGIGEKIDLLLSELPEAAEVLAFGPNSETAQNIRAVSSARIDAGRTL